MNGTMLAVWTRALGGLRTHAFVRLVQTHILSAAGDGLITVALAGSVFFNDSPNVAQERVALTLVLTVAPFAVVAPFLGPAIDRAQGGRRLILLSASAARSLLCLLMAVSLDSVALYPVAFLALVSSKAHAVAKSASVPELVKSSETLVRANSVLAVGAVVSGFVAAFIGFVVSSVAGPEWVLRAAAVIFACAAALALEVGLRPAGEEPDVVVDKATHVLDVAVWRAAAVMATLRASVGFLAFLIAFDLRRRGAATIWFGLAIAAGMIGSSVGNIVGPRIRKHLREDRMLVSLLALLCVSAVVVAQSPGRLTSALLAFILGACAAAGKLAFDSLVQRDAPATLHGRSFARFEAIFQLVWVIGALIPVVLVIPTRQGFWTLALVAALVGGWYLVVERNINTRQP